MLSAVLSSDYALEVSISIMNAFVAMRHYLADNAIVFQRLDRIELNSLRQMRTSSSFSSNWKLRNRIKPSYSSRGRCGMQQAASRK